MNKLVALCAAALVAPTMADAQALAGANGQRSGITAIPRHVFDDATMPGKEFRVLHTTYEPGGQNPKHYHPSHVVFYVLEGTGVWQEEGKDPVTLRTGESWRKTVASRSGMSAPAAAPATTRRYSSAAGRG